MVLAYVINVLVHAQMPILLANVAQAVQKKADLHVTIQLEHPTRVLQADLCLEVLVLCLEHIIVLKAALYLEAPVLYQPQEDIVAQAEDPCLVALVLFLLVHLIIVQMVGPYLAALAQLL